MRRTKSGLPQYCSWNIDQHGKRRVRFRKAGFSTYLNGTPWSEDFMRQHAAALDGVKAPAAGNIGAECTKPGSFNALVVSYYRSADFANLKSSTQAQRRNVIERFRAEHGTKPLKGLSRDHIKAIIASKAATPEAANHLLKVLRVMLAYAVDEKMIAANPAIGLKKYRKHTNGFHLWSEEEIAQFETRHPVGTKARTALALMLYTSQRRGDVIHMGWQHVRSDEITVTQQKTGVTLVIPMHPGLKSALESLPRTNLTFLMTEHDAPFTNAGFGNWWRDRCNEAGLLQCTAHGLRKAATVRFVEAGCTDEQIMSFTGIRSPSVLKIYKRGADQRRLARQALNIQLGAESEQKLSNLPSRLDKTARN
jgi:integrase